MNEAHRSEFRQLACALSPENLYCDGEISVTAARARGRKLMQHWRKLEKAVGRKVTQKEATFFSPAPLKKTSKD